MAWHTMGMESVGCGHTYVYGVGDLQPPPSHPSHAVDYPPLNTGPQPYIHIPQQESLRYCCPHNGSERYVCRPTSGVSGVTGTYVRMRPSRGPYVCRYGRVGVLDTRGNGPRLRVAFPCGIRRTTHINSRFPIPEANDSRPKLPTIRYGFHCRLRTRRQERCLLRHRKARCGRGAGHHRCHTRTERQHVSN